MSEPIFYTHAEWRVHAGRESDFIAAWNALSEAFTALAARPLWGTLLQSEQDSRLFYSFGPWASAADIASMRLDPDARAAFERAALLCENMTPGAYHQVAHVDLRGHRTDGASFKLEGLDHVALAVSDVGRSERWYREVLGLERRYEEVWGDFPAVVCAGNTCLALFPVGTDRPHPQPPPGTLAVRHVAFRVDRINFDRAQAEILARGIDCAVQDHTAALSFYFKDPDGHQLEITTYNRGDDAVRPR